MKPTLVSIVLALSLATGCAAVPTRTAKSSPAEAGSGGSLSLLVGQRSLDSTDWGPVEDQTTVALGFETPLSDWPVGFEANFAYSRDTGNVFVPTVGNVSVEGNTTEASAGVRKTWDASDGKLHPYIGGGLAYINAEAKAAFGGASGSDDDSSLAGYAHGGAFYDLSSEWHVGIDLRVLFGSDITIAGFNTDADYTQFGIFFAYSF